MKNLLIIFNIIVYDLVIVACASTRVKDEERIDFKKDKLIIVDQEKYIKHNISNLIGKAYSLKTGKKYVPGSNHQTFVDMIYFGSEYYKIDYKNIICIITIESEWNYLEYHVNRNNTIDYGLCQINSIHIESDYKIARELCDKYKIKYGKDIYDIKLNILSAFIYLDYSRSELNRLSDFNKYRWITSYNTGVRGSGSIHYKEYADKYWNKFINIRSQL